MFNKFAPVLALSRLHSIIYELDVIEKANGTLYELWHNLNSCTPLNLHLVGITWIVKLTYYG